jgi:DNA-binding response OmpR family regulator
MPSDRGGTGAAARILVVDDDPDLCDLLAMCLGAEGYAVQTARDGLAALAEVERFAPTLILLDLWMPVLDGRGFATRLREAGRNIPIVVLSAADDGELAARQIGAAAFLEKPFAVGDLLAVVADVLDKSPGAE